ncbi:MAG: DUF465 domain-containing protein [Alteromonadaceae bacterium]|nr:DUF465 domain-containing protein [Alteromonadaceae bacterium]
MPIENHSLALELPEYKDQIHTLKINNGHFKSLHNQYNKVEHEIHRIEVGAENTTDDYLHERKKLRLNLKDQLLSMLKAVN